MQLANAPSKIVEAFAAAGNKNTIPVPSQIPITPGAASWADGFPPLTMTAVNAGGVPPSGLDMNGVLNAISLLSLWFNAGAGFAYDATFAAAIGGYPKGARVLRADGSGYWFNYVDNNMSNPDAGGAGWIPRATSVYASAQQTLAVGLSKVIFDTLEFGSGFWDAGNHRFTTPVAGLYRISGAILLASPSGQNLATQIWHNGALAKQCFQAPQTSDVNLSLPFDATLQLAAGDFVEVFMNISQAPVLAGQIGTNQQSVFAQMNYIGT